MVNNNQAVSTSTAQIIYNQANGNLYYNDAGTASAVNFANLSNKPMLSVVDFQVS